MKIIKSKNIRVYIYAMLFLFIMIIDQRLHTGSITVSKAFVQALPLPFLGIMLLQMKAGSIRGIPYIIYYIVSAVSIIGGSIYFFSAEEFYLKYIVLLVEFVMLGFIILHSILNKYKYLDFRLLLNKMTLFWIALFILMCLSKYNGLWTWFLLVVFILLSLLHIDKKEQERILQGMIFGIMSSYVVIQGLAFVFRPYDTIRYKGLYNNTNMNALFYVVVFAAFLANQFRLNENRSRKSYRILNFIFMMSAMCFTILTIGKSAIITEIALLLIYMIIMLRKKKKKVKFFILQSLLWISTSIVLLPICFLAARYLPPVFHHSVWFYGEYSVIKVHSFDAYDSEKYPKVEEIAEELLERYLGIDDFFKEEEVTKEVITKITKASNTTQEVKSTAKIETEIDQLVPVVEPGSDKEHPLYAREDANNSYTARIGIWKEYSSRLNFFGHRMEEPHFWLTKNYYILHAHNVFLEFLYNFGFIVGGLFFLGYAVCGIRQVIRTYKTKDFANFTICIMLVILGIFGMFELDWYIGQGPLTLFFFMLCHMIWQKNRKEIRVEEQQECDIVSGEIGETDGKNINM